MDKPTRERTIIVNINGEKKEYKWIPSEDPGSLDTIEEIASTVEQEHNSPLWLSPEEEEVKKVEPTVKISKKTALVKSIQVNKLRILGAGIPVLVALMTGTLFGFVVLKIVLFGGGPEEVSKLQESIPVQGANPSNSTTEKKVEKDTNAFVIQGGVYSNEASAKERAALIEGDGIPTIILEQEGKHFIYIGAATTLEETKKLALLYKEDGVDTYWKEIRFEGTTSKAYTEEEIKLIQDMFYNSEQYTKVASAALLGKDLSEKPDIRPVKSESIPKELQNLYNLNESMKKTWSAYQSSSEESSLMQLQKCVLQFLEEWNKL